MLKNLTPLFPTIAFLTLALGVPSAHAQEAEFWKVTVRPFLQEHCVQCHGKDKHNGDLRLDMLAPEFDSSSSAGIWIEVMDRLNLGEMPPEDQPRPNSVIP